MFWPPILEFVISPKKDSSWARSDEKPEHGEVTETSLLASVKGGETGIGLNMLEENWSSVEPWRFPVSTVKEFQASLPLTNWLSSV